MNHQPKMSVGTIRIRLLMRGAHSLKDKRRVVKSIKDRVRHKFNASIAEVADLEVHQSAVLGVAVVGNERDYIQAVLSQIVNLAGSCAEAEMIACDVEIL